MMSSNQPDHYAALGLDRNCTRAQIDAAYRLLAKRHHPDINTEDAAAAERIRGLNEAHETLSDFARRRTYDRELREHEKPTSPAGRGRLERNISQEVNLRIEDFFRGASLDVQVRDPGNPNGAETYPVTILADTAPGTRLRVQRDAPFENGFVILRLRPLSGARYKARGSDLKCELRINARLAKTGGTEALPGPTGAILRINIPAGVRRGEIIRVAHAGLPKARGGRGDLLVRITYRPEVQITRR
ncbi:MAG: DnaJ domain-containing protein [Chthoniobacterales bacterium]